MKAIYGRQSLFKKDSLSIEQQLNGCVSLCEQNGWEYKTYSDAGYSGKNLNRPGFSEMMKDVKSGQIDKIICYKFDRISRNISDFVSLLEELQKYHCEFISISENFDTSSPIGRAMVYICMVFAQMERENISQRVHDNYYYRTELGFWGGGPAPYGYKLDKIKYKGKMHSILVPDEEESKIVRKMYEWYLDPTGSATKILTELNVNLGIRSRKGAQWTSRVVMEILSKPLYAPNDMAVYNYLISKGANITNPPEEWDGKASVDLYGVKGESASKHKRCRKVEDMYCNISNHDAIVDSDTWLRVQQKRVKLLRVPSRAGTGRNSYFTGLMICESCGTRVSYTYSRGSMGYYICSSKKNRGWTSCAAKSHAKKTTDPAIIEAIIEHYSEPAVIEKIKAVNLPEKKTSLKELNRRNELLADLAGIDDKINNLMDSIASGSDVMIKYINEKISELDSSKRTIEKELQLLDMNKSDELTNQETIRIIGEMLDDIPGILHNGDFDEIRDLCKLLVQEIVFKKDGDIDVKCTV